MSPTGNYAVSDCYLQLKMVLRGPTVLMQTQTPWDTRQNHQLLSLDTLSQVQFFEYQICRIEILEKKRKLSLISITFENDIKSRTTLKIVDFDYALDSLEFLSGLQTHWAEKLSTRPLTRYILSGVLVWKTGWYLYKCRKYLMSRIWKDQYHI